MCPTTPITPTAAGHRLMMMIKTHGVQAVDIIQPRCAAVGIGMMKLRHLIIGRVVEEFAAAGRGVEGGATAIIFFDAGGTTVAVVTLGGGRRRDGVPVDVGEGGVLLQEDSGEESIVHVDLGGVDDGLRGDEAGGDLGLLLFFHPGALALGRFFFQEGLDADAAGFGAEVATERVGAGEASAAAPDRAGLEVAFADELFLPGMQALVPLAVVLAGEGLAADCADEGALVGVRAEMGSEVVGAREALGAEVALESGRVFLYALAVVV